MPIYAYRCGSCGFQKDVLQKLSDAPLTVCPSCGEPAFSKQLSAPAFQLKGTGWYVTDFRDNGKKSGGEEAGAGGQGDADGKGKGDGDAGGKADAAKPEGGSPAAGSSKPDGGTRADGGAKPDGGSARPAGAPAAGSAAPAPSGAASTPVPARPSGGTTAA